MRTRRRKILDSLLLEELSKLSGHLIDIGGERKDLRSSVYATDSDRLKVTVINNNPNTGADVVCDASNLPFKNEFFDCGLCLEVLEHVVNPNKVLQETHRVLRTEGKLIISVPFLVGVHGDPFDFQRWTEAGLVNLLQNNGFEPLHVLSMGGAFDVMLDILRSWCYSSGGVAWRFWRCVNIFFNLLPVHQSDLKQNITTGYFLVCKKL